MAKYINTDLPFFDNSGAPLANGTVYFGVVNTNAKTSPRVPYLDQELTVEAASVQVLTSGGKLQQKLYLGGVYSVITDDVDGNQIAEDLSWSGIPEGIDSVLLPLSQNDIKQWPSVVGTTGTFKIDVNTDLYKTYVDEVGATFEIDGDKTLSDGFVAGSGFAVVWLGGGSPPTVTIVGNGSLELPAGASPRPRVVGSTIYIHRAQTGQPINNWFVTGDYEGLGASGSLEQTFISLDAGTEGAPALRRTGDTNTGLYFPASNQVAITVGGSEVAEFTASGLEVSADILAHRSGSSTKADLAVLNQDGGAIFTTHSSTTRISRTDNAGANEQAILSHDGSEVALFSPAGITPGLKLTGDQVQEVLRASGFEKIAAENTSPTFAGALFTSGVVVDVPLPSAARFDVRNDEGGLALHTDGGVLFLASTDIAGVLQSGPAIYQDVNETSMWAPGNGTGSSLKVTALEEQKVRRGGVDRLIAAEGTSPEFSALTVGGVDALTQNNLLDTISASTTDAPTNNQVRVLTNRVAQTEFELTTVAEKQTINAALGSFTLQLSDIDTIRSMDTPGAPAVFTCTIPASDAMIPINSVFSVRGNGSANWVLDYTGAGVTGDGLLSSEFNSTATFSDESWLTLKKVSSNEWRIINYSFNVGVTAPH